MQQSYKKDIRKCFIIFALNFDILGILTLRFFHIEYILIFKFKKKRKNYCQNNYSKSLYNTPAFSLCFLSCLLSLTFICFSPFLSSFLFKRLYHYISKSSSSHCSFYARLQDSLSYRIILTHKYVFVIFLIIAS